MIAFLDRNTIVDERVAEDGIHFEISNAFDTAPCEVLPERAIQIGLDMAWSCGLQAGWCLATVKVIFLN